MAHELAHAFNRIQGKPLPLTISNFEQGIKAFLRDEIDARKRENEILRRTIPVVIPLVLAAGAVALVIASR